LVGKISKNEAALRRLSSGCISLGLWIRQQNGHEQAGKRESWALLNGGKQHLEAHLELTSLICFDRNGAENGEKARGRALGREQFSALMDKHIYLFTYFSPLCLTECSKVHVHAEQVFRIPNEDAPGLQTSAPTVQP